MHNHPIWLAIVAQVLTLSYGHGQEADVSDRDRLFAAYGNLRTAAGTGNDQDGNFWRPSFEGAQGTTVELSNPHMTMADAAGNLYIADKESHSVLRIEPDGTIHTHAGTHVQGFNGDAGLATEIQLDNPNGLFVRPDGVVYVLDFLNERIRKVDRQGQLTTLVHDLSTFGLGRGLWVSPDEQLCYFHGPGTVKRWTPQGGIEVIVDSLSDPGNLTVDPNGALVVTSRGEHRVYRVSETGALTVIAGDGSTTEPLVDGVPATSVGLEDVRGVAFFPDSSYLVATMKGGDLWYVDTDGRIHRMLSGAPRGNVRAGDGQRFSMPGDKIAEPRAVTLAPNGDIIITTNDTGYVRVIERFQTPLFTGISPNRLQLKLTAGREHRIETSADLIEWSTWHVLDAQTTNADLSEFSQAGRFARVTW